VAETTGNLPAGPLRRGEQAGTLAFHLLIKTSIAINISAPIKPDIPSRDMVKNRIVKDKEKRDDNPIKFG
jgi:hypothetical protein